MAETTVLSERTLKFTYDETYGAYLRHGLGEDDARLFLVEGETYQIVWDGTEYSCAAFSAENSGITTNNLGNTIAFGGEDNGIPFLIASNIESGGTSIFALSTEESHTIAIYHVAEPVCIVLKDNNGVDQTYNTTKIRLNKSDGSKSIFSEGEAVENVPIALYFSGDNQVVTAPAGTLVKSAVIQKPETLVPENVAKGVEVAGIVGELAAETEEVNVALSMADGHQVITPTTEDKAMSKVTVLKPATLIPENIAEGVDIAGVIGSLKAGGGGAGGALVYTAVKELNITSTSAYHNTMIVSADELSESGIDLTQYTSWYQSGQSYVPFIQLTKLMDVNVTYSTSYRCITNAWISNIAHKPSSGSQWHVGQWMYASTSGTYNSTGSLSTPNTATNPLQKPYSSANSVQLLNVIDGSVYAALYYSSSVRYVLSGQYLITVMLIPTS